MLAFSPDGEWFAAGFQDGSTVVWPTSALDKPPTKVLRSGTQSASNSQQSPAVTALCFHPKGAAAEQPPATWLFTGQADGTVRRWDLSLQMTIKEAKEDIQKEKILVYEPTSQKRM